MKGNIKITLSFFVGLPFFAGGIWCIYNNKEIYIAYGLVLLLIFVSTIGIKRASSLSDKEVKE